MKQLTDYYRIPDSWVQFLCDSGQREQPGFFRFGNGVCYGRCSAVEVVRSPKQSMQDALPHAQVEKNRVQLPFNLDEVTDNIRRERYATTAPECRVQKLIHNLYYRLRPSLAVNIRKFLQRAYLAGWQNIRFPNWPIDLSVDHLIRRALGLGIRASGNNSVPFIWFWPKGYSSACIITHDVETSMGRDFCSQLMDMDESCGFKSAFQVIPEQRYEVPASYLAGIRERGFEVNVHDLNHDGMLFSDEKTCMGRVRAINRYGKEFGSRGFRAGVMYRNQEWFHALDFEFDMSVPNAGHLEAQRGGCCTVMPFFIGELLELPLTTSQDYTMFHILNERSIRLWQTEIDLIRRNHGLITILTHPDYLIESWAQESYLQLLRHLTEKASNEQIWRATPDAVNDWWRTRSKLCLSRKNSGWKIEGEGAEHARLAYAFLDGGNVRYTLVDSAEPRQEHACGNSRLPRDS